MKRIDNGSQCALEDGIICKGYSRLIVDNEGGFLNRENVQFGEEGTYPDCFLGSS
jgi:hypothetical protein